jgi:CDP-diacylglycerol--serine O-phosphatidyltransferase
MSEIQQNKIKLSYIIPNLFTAASLFLGVLSVIASTKSQFELASIYIFCALICDGLDGRVARMMGASSKFGAEFDSLADLIAFGMAPAMLCYFYVGYQYPRLGALVAGLFVVFGAIRLARFNVYVGITEPNVFIGLNIPTAAVTFSCWIMFFYHNPSLKEFEYILPILAIALSILMVSHIRYPSFKTLKLTKPQIFKAFIVVLAICSMLYLWFFETLTALVTLYTLGGLVRAAWNITIHRKKTQIIK